MGLFQKIFNKADDNGQVQRNTDDLKMLYLSNDPQTVARLRHAIFGDWNYSFQITKRGSEWIGDFHPSSHSSNTWHASLQKCDCGDKDEDGKTITPCQHMYRIALETGLFEKYISNLKIKALVNGMRQPLFNAFSEIVCKGYYENSKPWSGSKKTHDELINLNLIVDDGDNWKFSDYFMKNAAAFNYYVCIKDRYRKGCPELFDPDNKRLSVTAWRYSGGNG